MNRRTRLPLLAAAMLLALTPGVAADGAHAPAGPDAVVDLDDAVFPPDDHGSELVEFEDFVDGETYSWTVTSPHDYVVIEFRIAADVFDVERPRQIVPLLRIHPNETVCQEARTRGACEYPLFEWVPRVAVWDVDGPARIANHTTDRSTTVLRVGVPGPVNATLVLQRDVTPPTVKAAERVNLTWRDFYQETTTDELALVDLQVRRAGTDAWVQNPTPSYHVLQKFPVQGLDPDTEYEQRFVATDWAGNEGVTETTTFTTPPLPERPVPRVRVLAPTPEATVPVGSVVVIRAAIESPDSPVDASGVRVFYDLKEVHEGFEVRDGELVFIPPTVEEGIHTVSVEVVNEAGGEARERWTFTVGSPDVRQETPLPFALILVALAAAARTAKRT